MSLPVLPLGGTLVVCRRGPLGPVDQLCDTPLGRSNFAVRSCGALYLGGRGTGSRPRCLDLVGATLTTGEQDPVAGQDEAAESTAGPLGTRRMFGIALLPRAKGVGFRRRVRAGGDCLYSPGCVRFVGSCVLLLHWSVWASTRPLG